MTKLVNRAKMTTATTGTGTITLGSAVDGYQTFAAAGVADADVVRYVIEDGDAWEIGLGTYTASGTTLTRGSIESSNSDNALNLTGNATVFVSAAAADLQELVDFADNFVLPTADGSTGQVLTTNGAGTLSFTTITGYTNSDVDAHLNTGTASSGEVLSWNGSDYDWITSGGAFSVIGTNNLAAITTLPALTTGSNNFIAGNSGNSLSSGSANVSLAGGLSSITTGSGNFAYRGLFNLTTGVNNIAFGFGAGNQITTSGDNIVIGTEALRDGNGGSGYNVVIGRLAGKNLSGSALRNVAIGEEAGANSNGAYNIGVGYNATKGASAGAFTGGYNIGVGEYPLAVLTTGSDNIGIGRRAGFDLTSGANNFLGGYFSGTNLTTGSNNVAIGNGALDAATTGGRNIAIGQDAMGLGVATAASGDNIAIGYQAGYDLTTGDKNFLAGNIAGANLTSGSDNVMIGDGAGSNTVTGNANILVGRLAGRFITSNDNIFLGDLTGDAATTGSANVAIGRRAFRSLTTGVDNVAIGNSANGITTGSNNVLIGNGSTPSSATVSNEITLGNSSITNLRVPGVGFQFDTTDGLIVPKTVTAGGTTGAQTINKTAGTVNFAAAATSLVVTNSFVDANSIIIATVGTDDVTMKSVAVVAAAGSFTLYANAAATAETRVNWFVAN